MTIMFQLPVEHTYQITQTYDQHLKRAKDNGWCPSPGPCPSGIYYYPGVDFGGSFPVRADAAGVIEKIKMEHKGYGHAVYIDHGNKYKTILAHLKPGTIGVVPGEHIQAGHLIAMSNNTGFSTGDHLHYEVRRAGYPVDPMTLVGAPIEDGELPGPQPVDPLPGGKAITLDYLKLRSRPQLEGDQIAIMKTGTILYIEDDYIPADGYIWRKLVGQDLFSAEMPVEGPERYMGAVE